MEKNTVDLSPQQLQELKDILDLLISHYEPRHLICFGWLNHTTVANNSFNTPLNESSSHYYLLMTTKESRRIEHEVQDFVIKHFTAGNLTILVHGLETVEHAVNQGSRFFTNACRNGFLLYSSDGLRLSFIYPNLNPKTTFDKAEKAFAYRLKIATGFLEAAESCFASDHENNCVFLLHQAMEQACITMIRVFIAYRADMHSLSRLLNLCKSFTPEPSAIFKMAKPEDLRLFTLLQKSYSAARYQDNFVAETDDADQLILKVAEFLDLTKVLCQGRIEHYRLLAEAVEKPVDYSPAITASL